MLFHLLDMLFVVTHSQNAAMDIRIQRLDTAVHDFRKARDIADIGDGNSRRFDGLHRAARRYDFHASLMELAGKFDYTVFIRYADKCAFDLHK